MTHKGNPGLATLYGRLKVGLARSARAVVGSVEMEVPAPINLRHHVDLQSSLVLARKLSRDLAAHEGLGVVK